MAVKTLLACLMSRETADAVLACAVPLARAHGAHLVGLHTIEALLVYPGIAIHLPDTVFKPFNASQKAEADAIEAIFRKRTQAEEFVCEWRLLRADSTSAADRMIETGQAADLIIMPQEDGSSARSDQSRAQARVICESGRPVVIVPPEYKGPVIGQNIVLGWSATREATRAAHDVLTVAQTGAEVRIVHVDQGQRDGYADFDAADLAGFYDRHDLIAETMIRHGNGSETARILLETAFEQGADMLAVGAFGHSRAYDFILGAVTYRLLQEAKLPVLFST